MRRSSIIEARRQSVNPETRRMVEFSFQIVDRIHDILESKGMKQLPFDDLQPIFKEVASVAELSNMSSDDYNQYMDVIDYYRTTRAAYEMDRKESYAKGLAKGEAKGAKEATLKNAKAMKEENIPVTTIAKITGLTLDEIAEL